MPLTGKPIFLYLILALSVGYFITALSLGSPLTDGGVTPSFFPILLGATSILLSCVVILQKLRETADETAEAAPPIYGHLWVVAAIFLYIVAFKPLGYFISSSLFVFALVLLFSSFEKLLTKALISVAIVGVAYVMFQQLFGVRLPTLWG
jgi:putative tricarboxylic transport membrane protein